MRYNHTFIKKSQEIRSEDSFGIAITGGSTGSHIYPGIAVANEVMRQIPSASILFIGTKTGLEATIVPHEGFTFETVDLQGMKNHKLLQKLKKLYELPRAVRQARQLLKEFQPHVVLGTGGAVSVPVMYAAYLLKIPTIILEPNKQPEFESKLLCKSVQQIAVGFQETTTAFPLEKVVFTGIPIRKAFLLIGKIPPPDKGAKQNILIIGGSHEAKYINHAVTEALEYLKDQQTQFTFTHQSGADEYNYVKNNYESKGFRADVFEYIEDIPKMYAKAHIIICRAGASTIAELQASRRPAILIPSPRHENRQEVHACLLEDKEGIATIISEKDLSGKILAETILHCLQHPEEFGQVWSNHITFEEKTAAKRVVAACLQLTNINNIYQIA